MVADRKIQIQAIKIRFKNTGGFPEDIFHKVLSRFEFPVLSNY